MKPNPNATATGTRLICVYTYNLDDERNCLRVRQALRNLGVTWKIPYKTDADTYSGQVRKEWDSRQQALRIGMSPVALTRHREWDVIRLPQRVPI